MPKITIKKKEINPEIYKMDQDTKIAYFNEIKNAKRKRKRIQKLLDDKLQQKSIEKWLKK